MCQVVLEYQVQQVIGMQDCAFRSCWNVIPKSLLPLRMILNWRIASGMMLKNFFDHTFGGMWIKRIHYFQLTLNHQFIQSVLSEYIWIPYCVFFDYICLLILFSLLVGVTETNFTEYNKSDFIFGLLLLCTSLFNWTLVIVPPDTTGLSFHY